MDGSKTEKEQEPKVESLDQAEWMSEAEWRVRDGV